MLPKEHYTKADNKIIFHNELSDGAKVLYLALCGYRFGSNKWEDVVAKELGLSNSSYDRRKKELVFVGLVKVVQDGPRRYTMYIGNSLISANEVERIMEQKKSAG